MNFFNIQNILTTMKLTLNRSILIIIPIALIILGALWAHNYAVTNQIPQTSILCNICH